MRTKKVIACTCLAAALVFGLAGCGDKEPAENTSSGNEESEQLSGGWADSSSTELTGEQEEVFKKALETSGGDYTPIAYLASQVVAGTNHSFLCKSGDDQFFVIKVYEDLQGHCEITEVDDADMNKYGDLIRSASE